MKTTPPSKHRGFLLLEMILALAIFGMCATGFTVAMNRMARVAALAQSEMKVARFMQSALDETLSLPVLEEGENESEIETGAGNTIKFVTTVKLIDDMENEDGQILQEMYLIKVDAAWAENGQPQKRSVETWRYGRMYQP